MLGIKKQTQWYTDKTKQINSNLDCICIPGSVRLCGTRYFWEDVIFVMDKDDKLEFISSDGSYTEIAMKIDNSGAVFINSPGGNL